jgi:hypothetical protein
MAVGSDEATLECTTLPVNAVGVAPILHDGATVLSAAGMPGAKLPVFRSELAVSVKSRRYRQSCGLEHRRPIDAHRDDERSVPRAAVDRAKT